MIGQSISHYRVLEKIGEGGMGQVYLAKDSRLDRRVALKILPPELANDPERSERFDREARAASALNHPNIAHVYDVGEHDGVHFIAMEYVEGESLAARLARGGMSMDELLGLAAQIADGLEEASAHGVTHRDLKPGNIVITPRGQVKILDFGLAKLAEKSEDESEPGSERITELKTETGVVMGTVHYMSPEQALARDVDIRSDLFSFGIILYEMAAGRLPFKGHSVTETIDHIVHSEPEALARFHPDVPAELERIVRKCLEKDRDRRYQTPRDVRIDLENLTRDRSSSPSQSQSQALSPATPPKRRPRALTIGIPAAAAVAVAVALALFVLGDFEPAEAAIDSIAIVPFQNSTGDPEIDFLTDGISENLINSLCQLPSLKVTSRTSAFVFKNTDDAPEEIAQKLGVRALVLGSLARQGDELSISAELVDVHEGRQLWGERYRRSADDMRQVEEEIARTIATTLRSKLSSEEAERMTHRHTDDPESYRLYLRGRQYLIGTFDEMDRAVSYFQQAIEREPDYALAHAALAEAYTLQAYLRWDGREETARKARAEAERALRIDDGLAEARAVSGMVKFYFDWEWEGAEADLKRAVELNPGSAIAYEEYTNLLMTIGKLDLAEETGLKAAELDPLSVLPTHQLGILYMLQGRYEDSARQFARAQELRPNWIWGYIKRAKALTHAGRYEEALAEAARAEAILGGEDNPLARSWLSFTYAHSGEEGRAREVLARLQTLSSETYLDPATVAIVHTALGEKEEAVAALVEAFEDRSPFMVYAKVFPRFYDLEAIEDDPRYEEILRSMKFPG